MFRLWKKCAVSRNSLYVLLVALILPLMNVRCFATPLNNVFEYTTYLYCLWCGAFFLGER